MSAWRAFREGATRPSLPALLGTLVVAAVVLGSAAVAITPSRLAFVDPAWLQVDGYDKHTRVTLRSYRIRAEAREPLAVALIGASDFEHALPSEAELSAELSRRVGRPVPVHLLCAGRMRMWDMRALVDSLDDRVGGAIVIGSNPTLFASAPRLLASSQREARFAFDSAALDEELRFAGFEAEPRTGLYFVDHHRFLAPRLNALLAHALLGPVRSPQQYRALVPIAPGQRIPLGPRVVFELEGKTLSPEMFDRLVARQRDRGTVEIALVEMPWHPKIVAQLPRPQHEAYTDLVAQVRREHAVHYWDLRAAAGLRAADYGDAFHIARPEARRRFARELAKRLAPLLRARAAQMG